MARSADNSTLVAVAPRENIAGWNGPERPGKANALEVMDLRAAIERVYTTDAHMVMYVVRGADRHPRINKDGLASFPNPVDVTVFVADWDRPGHDEWPVGAEPEIRALVAEWKRIPLLQSAGFFSTRRGMRIVQPLLQCIPMADALPHFQHWYAALTHEHGIALDQKCASSVNRIWRLANVRRSFPDGAVDIRAVVVDLDSMRPIEAPKPPQWELARHQPSAQPDRRPKVPRPPVPRKQAANVGEPWCWRVPLIAAACRSERGVWHELFLTLSGALLDKQAPPSELVAIIRAIADATGADTRVEDRENAALSTLRRYENNDHYAGFARLRERWRDVAIALDDSLVIHSQQDLDDHLAGVEAAQTTSVEAIVADLRRVIEDAPEGVTLIAADCGVGKTHTAIQDAVRRAQLTHSSPTAQGKRAPLGSKTAISVDKHELAKQIKRDIEAQGPAARRRFGPLSVLREDGTPECQYHTVARQLVAGGQSMQWELCEGRNQERCEFYDGCRAREGVEGPDDARITIGPHALAATLAEDAGSTGVLVLDETPPLLDVQPLTLDDLRTAREHLSDFEWRFAAALTPAIESFEWWLQLGADGQIRAPADVVRDYAAHVDKMDVWYAQVQTHRQDTIDPVEFVQDAIPEDVRRRAGPPLRSDAVFRAKRSPSLARALGAASRVLQVVYGALTTQERSTVWIDTHRAGQCALVFTQPDDGLLRALRRQGATLVLDANAEVNLPLYKTLLGYEPQLHTYEAPDGAEIERTHLFTKQANRAAWFQAGRLRVADSLLLSIEGLFRWADSEGSPRKLGIITMSAVELALQCLRDPADEQARQKWRDMGQSESVLASLRERVEGLLQSWPGEIVFGHYGAIRGLNSMADVDLLATLGDPFPNVGDVANECAFAEIDITERARGEQLCAGELKQAHGRIRPVHRHRPGRCLHIGRVRPEGRAWLVGVEQRALRRGRIPNHSDATTEEMVDLVAALGGVVAAARRLGCSRKTLSRYLSGRRQPEPRLLAALRQEATTDAA